MIFGHSILRLFDSKLEWKYWAAVVWNQYKQSIFKESKYVSTFQPKGRRVEIVIPAGLIDRIKLLCIVDVTEGDKQNVSKEYPTIGLGDVDVYTRTCIQWCRGVDTIKLNEPLPSLPFERDPSHVMLLRYNSNCSTYQYLSHSYLLDLSNWKIPAPNGNIFTI